jgi:hypothetical protein
MKQRIVTAKSLLFFTALLLLATAGPAMAGRGNADNPGVLPPQSHPHGKSYGEWGAAWWQWVLGLPVDKNPIMDPDGRFGALGQSGSVWFLAGTFSAKAERSVTVPTGKSIFFPLINIFNDYPCPDPTFQPPPGQTLEEFLAAGAAAFIDPTTEMTAEVDGVSLENLFDYRGISPLSAFTADPSWVVLDPCVTGRPQVGVSDGYWVMLTPLTPGKHTIHFTSATSTGFGLDVTCHLTVR